MCVSAVLYHVSKAGSLSLHWNTCIDIRNKQHKKGFKGVLVIYLTEFEMKSHWECQLQFFRLSSCFVIS